LVRFASLQFIHESWKLENKQLCRPEGERSYLGEFMVLLATDPVWIVLGH